VSRIRGPWSEAEVGAFLETAVVPLRLGCQRPSGFPLVLSIWFVHEAGALWCATQARSRVARLLADDPRCGFEVAADAPPYRGVRGPAEATLVPERGEAVLRAVLARYQGGVESPLARWLLARAASEVALRIAPLGWTSFDYTPRMRTPA